MKRFLRLTRLFVCLCAVLSSTSAFAGANWVGAGVINVNGTWYYADSHSSTTWASGAFSNADLGNFTTTLTLGGQVQLYEKQNDSDAGVERDHSSTVKMRYKFDDATDFTELTLNWKKMTGNNNMYQSGAIANNEDAFTATSIDISTLALGNHKLKVQFAEDNGYSTEVYTANFTKNPAGYYVVGIMNSWKVDYDYILTRNLGNTEQEEYVIDDMALNTSDQFKVVYSNDGTAKTTWYPGDGSSNFGQNNEISSNGTYSIYFRPGYNGNGNGWFSNVIYINAMTKTEHDENVTLASTGYGTYYNGSYQVTLPAGVVAYIVTDGTPTYQEIANGDEETNTIPAGTAVLLYSATVKAGGQNADVTLTLTPSSEKGNYSTNLLHGSNYMTTTTGGATYYKLTFGDNNGSFGWYWGAVNGAAFDLPANKVWLALPTSPDPSAGARGFLDLPGEDATGIASVASKLQGTENVWYDLNGRRINAPMTKGIYVKDGRKLVIK